MPILFELIATSLDDCLTAAAGGADRIELCSALPLGGLTPSLGLLGAARAAVPLPIMAMIRPRHGGFAYSDGDFAVMLRDAKLALAHGADGIVFGCLLSAGEVDINRTRALVELAGDKETVFSRAFDAVADPIRALDQLLALGVTRVLTSGGQPTALAGAANLAAYRRHVEGRLQILPGGGITVDNVAELLRLTRAEAVHASLSGHTVDPSLAANPTLRFGAAALPPEDQVRIADPLLVRAVRAALDRYPRDDYGTITA
jgi:copper homeostasis protein